MKSRSVTLRFVALLLCLAMVGCASNNSLSSTPISVTRPAPQLIATNVDLTGAVVAGKFVFWKSSEGTWETGVTTGIYGYNVEQGEVFTVTEGLERRSSLYSDGKSLLWVAGDEEAAGTTLHILDLETRTERSLPFFNAGGNNPNTRIANPIVDGDTLFYNLNTTMHSRSLETGQEKLVAAEGRRPIAGGGTLLWVEPVPREPLPTRPVPTILIDEDGDGDLEEVAEHQKCCFTGSSECQLLMLRGGETGRGMVLDKGEAIGGDACSSIFSRGYYANYAVSGDNVAWVNDGRFPDPPTVKVHNISSGTTREISAIAPMHPLISDDTVAWTEGTEYMPGGEPFGPNTIKAHNLATGTTWVVVPESPDLHQAWGIIDERAVVYTLGTPERQTKASLYVTDLTTP
jgi:hypothetical protein